MKVKVPTNVLESGKCEKLEKCWKVEKEIIKNVVLVNAKFDSEFGELRGMEKIKVAHRRSNSEIKDVCGKVCMKFVENQLGKRRNLSVGKGFRINSGNCLKGNLGVGRRLFVRSKLLPLFLQSKVKL